MATTMDTPILLPWWRQPRWLGAGTGIAVLALLAGAWQLALSPQRTLRVPLERLTIATVEHATFRDFVPLRAHVVPMQTVYLDALEGGRVEQVFVHPGDFVIAGQPIVKLGNTELELTVLDREARLIESIVQLEMYQTQLEQNRLQNEKELARIDYEIVRLTRSMQRRKALAARGVEAQEVSEAVEDELHYLRTVRPLQAESNERQDVLRRQQAPQIAAKLEKLHKDIEITRGKLDNLLVRAPSDGQMTAIALTIGENLARGARLGELTPQAGYKLTAYVDEYYLGRLRKDHAATVEIDAKQWPLRVIRVHPQVRNGTFEVELVFVGSTPEVLPGQTVQGRFTLGEDRDALVIPAGPFLQQTGGHWIFVLATDGQSAARRAIQAGRRSIEQVEILEGLRPGERVVISDYASFARIDELSLSE